MILASSTLTESGSESISPPAFRSTGFERAFFLLIIFYWLLQFLQGDSVEMLPIDTRYYFFVGPAVLFAFAGFVYVAMTAIKIDLALAMLMIFNVLLIVVSLSRGDSRTIVSVGMLALTTGILFQVRPRISLNLINVLFLISIVLTTALFFFEYSIYTFIPGLNRSSDLWWRVSPMPSAAEGGLFAMIVFLANFAFRNYRWRWLMIGASGYFVVLTGNRTSILATLFGSLYLFLRQQNFLATRWMRITFFVVIFAVFMLSIFGSQFLLSLPFADNEVLKTLIFRDEAVGQFDVDGQVGTAAVRQWIFDQHLAAFRESPLVGIGTFDLRMLTTGYGALDDATTGSEAFVTGLLARIGLLSTLFFGALFVIRQPVKDAAADLSASARIALLVGMFTYGSFVNAYDFVFVLLIIMITGCVMPPKSMSSIGDAEHAS